MVSDPDQNNHFMKPVSKKAFLLFVTAVLLLAGCKKKEEPPVLPAITLGPITEITDVSAKVEINITSDGRSPITDVGVKYNSTGCATCPGSFTRVSIARLGKDVLALTGLKKATTYTIVAYVTNEVGTYTTPEITFSTSATPPIINDDINTINLITGSTAYMTNFKITDDGGATAVYSGACWSTNPNPTIADFSTKDTIINKAYTGLIAILTNLKHSTKYYVRPYAINSVGIRYGKEISFTTDVNNSCQPNIIEPEAAVSQILTLPNNKFMLVGNFRKINGLNNFNIGLFNNDGSFDNSFTANLGDYTYNNNPLNNSSYLSNGKILLTARNNSTAKATVIRLNPNGSLDNSFNIPTGTQMGIIYKMFPLADGKIILVGRLTDFNGATVNKVLRLNIDGSIDGTFAISPTYNFGTVMNAVLLNNGTILIQSSAGSSTYQNVVIKTDGSFDTSSKLHNTITPNFIISVLKNNQFICYNAVYAINRMNADGTNDNSFLNIKIAGSPTASSSYMIEELSDGKYLVGVNSFVGSQSAFTLYRLNSNGTPDASFGPTGAGGLEFRNGNLYSLTMSSDGKILVGGNFTLFMDRTARYFIKLNANGSFCN